MPTRIYDSSQLTKRRAEKLVAGSFLNRMYPPNNSIQPQQGSAPLLGILDSSIMNLVNTGKMTEFTDLGGCTRISAGCPCSELNSSLISTPQNPALPGSISGITFTVGSIVVSWNAPTTNNGPFVYRVTPYINGVALDSITTSETSYRFTDLQEWQPYTFTVCAINSNGDGPIIPSSSYFLAPPVSLSKIMEGSSELVDIVSALKYVINAGLDNLFEYAAKVNLGPTRGSRFMYVWIASVVGAWNWVRAENSITGIHDNWNWSAKASNPLSDNDSIIWLCSVIDYITPFFIPTGYVSIYNCPSDIVNRVKNAGEWSNWLAAWELWRNYRFNDGSIAAATLQPNATQNVNINNPIIIDGVTINNIDAFPGPQKWAALWLKNFSGTPQKYLTYSWDNVLSSCLTESQEQTIQANFSPVTGVERDAEIDEVKNVTAGLTDTQKCCAEFWAGGPGTVSPPLMFIWFWKEYVRGLNTINNSDNIMYSLLDLGIHLFEGGRVTWRLKAAYMESRPIQEIRRRYNGQEIVSWNGTIDGGLWIPYQTANFVTPPFADFPSGHSHFSTAFALTMGKWFGANIQPVNIYYDKQTLISPLFSSNTSELFGTFIIDTGRSEVEPTIVPSAPITLRFGTWNEMSSGSLGAGISRIYGGIHAQTANIASQNIATELDVLINNAWNIQVNI